MPQLLEAPTITSAPRKTGPRRIRGKGELWDLAERHLCWMMASQFSPLTVKNTEHELLRFNRFLEAREFSRIADVAPEVMESYAIFIRRPKNGINPRPHYVQHRLVVLRRYFRWLITQGLILSDPTDDLELPKVPQHLPHTILTQSEARRLLDAPNLRSPVGYRDKALLELLYATGIRSRELLRLKAEDVDFKERTVLVRQGKCRKDRLIPVPQAALNYVAEYVEKIRPRFAKNAKTDDGILFINWTGAKLNLNRLCELISRNTKIAGIVKRVTALTFRHSIATHLLENGLGIRHIQEFLGHEQLTSTEVYTKVTLTGLRKQFGKFFPAKRRFEDIPSDG